MQKINKKVSKEKSMSRWEIVKICWFIRNYASTKISRYFLIFHLKSYKYHAIIKIKCFQQIQQQYRGRAGAGARCWGSMSEGGGVSAAGGDSCKTNLIVNYLPQTMTEKDLYAMFMTIGPIESCRVMKDFKVR